MVAVKRHIGKGQWPCGGEWVRKGWSGRETQSLKMSLGIYPQIEGEGERVFSEADSGG